jgi:hypothetical protein
MDAAYTVPVLIGMSGEVGDPPLVGCRRGEVPAQRVRPGRRGRPVRHGGVPLGLTPRLTPRMPMRRISGLSLGLCHAVAAGRDDTSAGSWA